MSKNKIKNEQFFNSVLEQLNEGGVYLYPAVNEVFTKIDNKLVGTERGITIIKNITTPKFYNKLKIK